MKLPISGLHCWAMASCDALPDYFVQWKCLRCGDRGVGMLCRTHAGQITRREAHPLCGICLQQGLHVPLLGAGLEGLN